MISQKEGKRTGFYCEFYVLPQIKSKAAAKIKRENGKRRNGEEQPPSAKAVFGAQKKKK